VLRYIFRYAQETKLHGIHKKRSCIECSAQNVPTPSCPARHPDARTGSLMNPAAGGEEEASPRLSHNREERQGNPF
jgi:hypothetical protein